MAVVQAYATKAGKRYQVRYRTPDNRQTDKRGFTTKREAERFANTVEVAKLRGEYVNPADARKTVDALGVEWLARQKGHLKPSGYAVMETTWRVRVKPRWGHVALGDIEPTAVQTWMAELGQSTGDTKAVGAAAVKRAHHVLSQILADAMRDNLIPKNPAAGLKLPRTKRKTPVFLNHHQVAPCLSNESELAPESVFCEGDIVSDYRRWSLDGERPANRADVRCSPRR